MSLVRTDSSLRVYLVGRVCAQRGRRLLDERKLPGPQGRLVFSFLAAEHHRAVSRDELAHELWGEEVPRSWDTALRAVISKLRGSLSSIGLGDPGTISHAFGCYQLQLPTGTWVDLEAAAEALHMCETHLRSGQPQQAAGWALAARAIAGRPFLAGAEGPWASSVRSRLRDLNVRALESLADVWIWSGDPALAIRDAERAVAIEPFRESAYRHLMQALAAAGNRAQALQVYERCRRLLADHLGVDPSAETQSVYLDLLRTA